MFGLMRARCGGHTETDRQRRRLHYCGTCKTLGGLYGQRTRMLLNFDAVFLAELLTALAGEDTGEWERSYQSYNCLNLPQADEAMPLPLQVAATATVILAEFKLEDHIADSRKRIWQTAQRYFTPAFRRAELRLRGWDFPLDRLRESLATQASRERKASSATKNSEAVLDSLAEPTATATGIFFGEGARIVGRPDLSANMQRIGQEFGALVYLLDALDDYDKDGRKGAFNAIQAAYHSTGTPAAEPAGYVDQTRLKPAPHSLLQQGSDPRRHGVQPVVFGNRVGTPHLPAPIRAEVAGMLRDTAGRIAEGLRALPIPAETANRFIGRLNANLSRKIGTPLRMACACPGTEEPDAPRYRLRDAIRVGSTVIRSHFAARRTAFTRVQAPFVFASAVAIALIFPEQARKATTHRECLDLGMNLMLLGGLIGTVVTAPIRWLPIARTNMQSGPTHTQSVRRRRVRADGGPACFCFCCPDDCCAACCLAEMCAECSCDACACAECLGGGCECCAAGG